jgi:hypothetical protein
VQEVLFHAVSHLNSRLKLALSRDAQCYCGSDSDIAMTLFYRESVLKGIDSRQWFI